MLAWRIEKAMSCPDCGTREDEWKENPLAYTAESFVCAGCETLEWEVHDINMESTRPKGIKYRLVSFDPNKPPKLRPVNTD